MWLFGVLQKRVEFCENESVETKGHVPRKLLVTDWDGRPQGKTSKSVFNLENKPSSTWF